MRNVTIVTQRVDGRGGINPRFAGADLVRLDGELMLITTDGRFNIPKRVFDKYSIRNRNGRKSIAVGFTTQRNGVVYAKVAGLKKDLQ